ncbi:MAG: peptidyl-prolyl cis-trans isomerase [Muribaculaceae bacterium]|nr:peptidyl-prolyl cis-trans isomerase [Muribaculaceae bacterium]
MRHLLLHIVSAITVLAFLTACNNTNEGSDGGNVLVRLGNSTLTATEVRASIPAGTESADSLRLAQRYIDQWIDTHLITDVVAPSMPDIDEINRLTEQYRLSLIEDAYRTRMYRKNGDDNIPEDSLRAYYDKYKDKFRLKSPIVKGVYLKFPDDSKALKEARKLIKSSTQDDVDKLEKIAYDNAVNYDYFRDRWVDWQKMMALIPSDFGSDPMSFPLLNRYMDISADGFTYLLNITDCKGVGEQIPYEYAREQIRSTILYEHRKEYDRSLRNQLKEEALENGKLVIYN